MERSQVEKENEVNGEEWERQNKYMRNSSKKAVYWGWTDDDYLIFRIG